MDKMQSKQHTLREETLTHNTLDCMVCLKKHPINQISVIKKVQSYETWTVYYSCVQFVWVEGSGGSELDYI